jgi:SAM-dependent methyltransferase
MHKCIICQHTKSTPTFPWKIQFNKDVFQYRRCFNCLATFVSPTPSRQQLYNMYSRNMYHDVYYGESCLQDRDLCVITQITKVIQEGSRILDYGCGSGGFLKSVGKLGFTGVGVEFSEDVVRLATINSGCPIYSTESFNPNHYNNEFSMVHFGDVLEHLEDPSRVVQSVFGVLKPGGILVVNGPLEDQASLVYFCSVLYGRLKKIMNPRITGSGVPYHLSRMNLAAQMKFFENLELPIRLKYLKVYENGWPYSSGGILKRGIANIAKSISRIASVFKLNLGNRVILVYEKLEDSQS